MNLLTITAQIVKQPKLVKSNNCNMICMSVVVPNEKKTTSYFQLYVYISTTNKYKDFCELYTTKDIVILTGYIYLRQYSDHLLKSYNYMIMKVDDIQPCMAFIQ